MYQNLFGMANINLRYMKESLEDCAKRFEKYHEELKNDKHNPHRCHPWEYHAPTKGYIGMLYKPI